MNIGGKLREVSKNTSIYAIASISQSAISFLLLPLYSREFSTSEYGSFALLQMFSTIASTIFYLGLNSALPRFYYEDGDRTRQNNVFNTVFFMTSGGAIVQFLLSLVFARTMSFHIVQNDSLVSHVVLIFLASAIAMVNQVLITQMRLLDFTFPIALASVLSTATSVGLSFVLVVKANMGVLGPIYAGLIAHATCFFIYLKYCKNEISTRFKFVEVKGLLVFGISAVFVGIATMTIEWSDRLMIKHFLTLAEVGIYSFIFRIGSMIGPLFVNPFSYAWGPMMMRSREDGNQSEFVSFVICLYFFASAVLVISAACFIRTIILIVTGKPEYIAASGLVPIVLAGTLFNGLNNIASTGIFYSKKTHLLAIAYYSGAIISVSLNLVLISRLGMVGSALSNLVTNSIIPVMVGALAWKYFPIHLPYRRIGLLFVVTVFSGLLTQRVWTESQIYDALLKIVFLLLFVGASFLITFSSEQRWKILRIVFARFALIRQKILI
ncbi:MAG: hypothetical protein EOP04_13745, partial [Proteobacteria bacterium]